METRTFDEVKTDKREITTFENNYGYVIPRCDISETSDRFVIELEMLGTKKESLSVKLQNGHLVVDGKMVMRDHGKLIYSEILRRNYHRVFKLSDTVDANGIEAKWNEGVLVLNLKKKEEAKPREININF